MKHLIILGDGMADHPIEALGGLTPLQAARTPHFDLLARLGRSGTLVTVPEGFAPGSEVANTAILGYDLHEVYEGRGPLEAASIGYEMEPGDMAMRCNIVTLSPEGTIVNHHGGHLTTERGRELISMLNCTLGSDRVKFIPGIQYRHLLVIKGGDKRIVCAPPHDHADEAWAPLLPKPMFTLSDEPGRMSPRETCKLLRDLILRSQQLLSGKSANSIWPWSPGYRPRMSTLMEMWPEIRTGAVISAVDLIRGIGRYAGLRSIVVEGATGMADTNYEGKARAALDALATDDFVFLHVEASDEASHDGDLDLKIRTIEDLDSRVVGPIMDELSKSPEPVSIALLPDHPTPVVTRAHAAEPVPFTIYTPGAEPDSVSEFSEAACAAGSYGTLRLDQFMKAFMKGV